MYFLLCAWPQQEHGFHHAVLCNPPYESLGAFKFVCFRRTAGAILVGADAGSDNDDIDYCYGVSTCCLIQFDRNCNAATDIPEIRLSFHWAQYKLLNYTVYYDSSCPCYRFDILQETDIKDIFNNCCSSDYLYL